MGHWDGDTIVTYGLQLLRVVLNRLGIKDFTVMLAHFQVLVVVVGQNDLLLEIAQLQVRDVVINLHGSLIGTTGLLPLLGRLLELLNLFGTLLRLAGKVALVDLAAEDRGLRPVAALYAESHLLQNELRLFSPGHGPKRLHLQLAKNVGGGIQIALGFLDVG